MTKCSFLEAKYGFNLGHTIGMVICDSDIESSIDYDDYELDGYPTEPSLGARHFELYSIKLSTLIFKILLIKILQYRISSKNQFYSIVQKFLVLSHLNFIFNILLQTIMQKQFKILIPGPSPNQWLFYQYR